jgi:hypothetical protein
MCRILFLLVNLLLVTQTSLFAQSEFTIDGYITDSHTKEPLVGASVYIPSLQRGSVANKDGFYSIKATQDSVTIVFSYAGYASQKKSVYLNKNIPLNVELETEQLQEVLVTGQLLQEKLETTQMSVETMTAKEAKLLPALFGEVDIIKTLQLKPGIQSGGEGSSGLYVRGGGPDQNLMLLDEALVYNASHLFGFFSVFNSDAVDNIQLYKAGFPAEFGGRLSSVVDVRSREGNRSKFAGTGGIGLISSRLTLEGPLQKDKSSFIISGRRTYFDLFTRMINQANEGKMDYNPIPDYYFYDTNGKLSFNLGKKDKLLISGYYGRDVFHFKRNRFDINFNWGNAAATAQWQHCFTNNLSAELTYTFSDYNYDIRNSFDVFDFQLGSSVRDHGIKYDFSYYSTSSHFIRFGAAYNYHQFTIGRADAGSADGNFNFKAGNTLYGSEFGAYISDDFKLSNRWQLNGGLRLSGFIFRDKIYKNLEPRASARYMLSESTSLKASYARMNQYIHLVSSSGASLPTDIWYPTTLNAKPERSDQLAAGLSTFLFGKKLLLTNEVYYKKLDNQIDFRDGANLIVNDRLEDEFVYGKGWSYGNEIYLEKKNGKTTGWIGYTLAWTWRQFNDINFGKKFFPRYDRRHDVSVVIMHELSKKLSLTGTWVYGSGNAVSLPTGRFYLQDLPGTTQTPPGFNVGTEYSQRNTFRLAPYHRLDLGLVWRIKSGWGDSDLTFSVYNAYNRLNPYFVYFETVTENADGTGNITKFQARQVSLFPVIPSVTYNFKF